MNALPLSPLGGKASLGQSPVVAAELARFDAFKRELLSVGAVNTNEKALACRRALLRNQPSLAETFRALGYSV